MSANGRSADTLDLTERKRLEDRLREAFRLLREAGEEGERLVTALIEAQEGERRRIVRDIHDDPLQVMTAIRTRLSSLRQRVPSALREELATVEELAQQAITRLRAALFEPPAGLERLLLLPTLQARLHLMQEQAGVECVLRNRVRKEPPMEARIALLRIATEALTNVRKHAAARRVEVRLEEWNGGVRLSIEDDGKGFRLHDALERTGHLGLRVMRERAELVGGWLRVDAAPGRGTTVECWVPVTTPLD